MKKLYNFLMDCLLAALLWLMASGIFLAILYYVFDIVIELNRVTGAI